MNREEQMRISEKAHSNRGSPIEDEIYLTTPAPEQIDIAGIF